MPMYVQGQIHVRVYVFRSQGDLGKFSQGLGLSIKLVFATHLTLGFFRLSRPKLGLKANYPAHPVLIRVLRIQTVALLVARQVFEMQRPPLSL